MGNLRFYKVSYYNRGANPQGVYWQILENGPSQGDFPAVNCPFFPLLVENGRFQLPWKGFFGPSRTPKQAHCLVLRPFSGPKNGLSGPFFGPGVKFGPPIGGSKWPFFNFWPIFHYEWSIIESIEFDHSIMLQMIIKISIHWLINQFIAIDSIKRLIW